MSTEQNENINPENEVGITDGSIDKQYQNTPDEDPAASRFQRTKLLELMNENWGLGYGINNDIYKHLVQYVVPDSAEKNSMGFEVTTLNDSKIQWLSKTSYRDEKIYVAPEDFNQNAAATIIAMGRLRGWTSFNLSGNSQHKEMLWLAVQRQNLIEKEVFLKAQQAGKIPSSEQYKDLKCDFQPLPDSPALALHQKDLEEFEKRNPSNKTSAAVNSEIPEIFNGSADTPLKDQQKPLPASKEDKESLPENKDIVLRGDYSLAQNFNHHAEDPGHNAIVKAPTHNLATIPEMKILDADTPLPAGTKDITPQKPAQKQLPAAKARPALPAPKGS